MMKENLIDKISHTVSELNRAVKVLLETNFQMLWVEGEISNLSRPQSGHLYFTLKDANAQVRCAMFRTRSGLSPIKIENGMQILAYAKISLYEGRGDYQLIIEQLEEKGEGLLKRRFEILRNKLASEGLFDVSRKKSLPTYPKKIGVITSSTGAAIKDVLSVLKRRFSCIPIILYPTAVQGELAANQIAEMIRIANKRNECDVLILCRGGGALEDLWAFNEEVVARALDESHIPIVSGIGHEIDFTIADFVVDQRAPTPSAAAELVSPSKSIYYQQFHELNKRFIAYITNEIKYGQLLLQNYQGRILDPRTTFQHQHQRITILAQTLEHLFKSRLKTEENKFKMIRLKLYHLNPLETLKTNRNILNTGRNALFQFITRELQQAGYRLSATLRTLNSVSPLQTLERSYSITLKDNQVIDDIAMVTRGDWLKIQLKNGYIHCIVEKTESGNPLLNG